MSHPIELRHLRKAYAGHVAVHDVSMAVPPATVYGLLGPNGAGKTTTIRMLMNIIAPDAGEVLFFGRPATRADLRRVGYLPEERGLYRRMTVVDQLVFLAELQGLKSREAMPRITRWLERFELAAWAGKKVEELSKGMQQKVQLIGTVLHDPEVIVLDEPFSGLDPLNQGLFKDAIAEFKREGKAILFSTHVMEQAEKLCDEICLISRGEVVLAGPLDEVKRRFAGNAYRLVAGGAVERIGEVSGVTQVTPDNGTLRLLLAADADSARVLRDLVSFLEVREFSSVAPELEEIFIKAVRDAA